MISNVESIKIVIMTAFDFYRQLLVSLDKEELDMIKKIDSCNTIEELKEVVNNKKFKKIKEVLLDKNFLEYLKENNFSEIQLSFISNL